MTFTCTSSQHPFFTQGQNYEGTQGTFGWLVQDNNGNMQHIGSLGCFQTSLYMDSWTTWFQPTQ